MLRKTVILTGLRREILSALSPGAGASADELKRRVALSRGLSPDRRGWSSFNTSFARALRRLEELGAVEVEREQSIFQKACARWVRLAERGEQERERLLEPREHALGRLARDGGSELLPSWERLLACASDRELERLGRLLEAERLRRAVLS